MIKLYNKVETTHPTAIPQLVDAVLAACSNNVKPTKPTHGTIVSGVMIFTANLPSSPVAPMTTWNRDAMMIAPDSSLIRTIHSSSFCSSFIAAITESAGHFHLSRLKIASVGTRNEIVPPYK